MNPLLGIPLDEKSEGLHEQNVLLLNPELPDSTAVWPGDSSKPVAATDEILSPCLDNVVGRQLVDWLSLNPKSQNRSILRTLISRRENTVGVLEKGSLFWCWDLNTTAACHTLYTEGMLLCRAF